MAKKKRTELDAPGPGAGPQGAELAPGAGAEPTQPDEVEPQEFNANPGVAADAPVAYPWIAAALQPLATPLKALAEDPLNARKHSPDNLARIERSLRAHGQQKPIVVYRGVVIAGNGTLAVARDRLKWSHIAVVEFHGTAHQARAFGLADNHASDDQAYDDERRAAQLRELEAEGLLDATGYDDAAFRAALEASDKLMADLDQTPGFTPEGDDAAAEDRLDHTTPITCPKCGHEFEKP